MTILSILDKLISISGTNDRIAELAKHKDNKVLKQVLFFAHDPNTTFGMKNMRLQEGCVYAGNITLEQSFDVLNQLSARTLTGNAGREAIGTVFNELTFDDATVFARILQQDLKIAMGIKNINKAIAKDFLKETPYMRCELTTPKTLKKIRFKHPDGRPASASEVKMDGQYLNHIMRNYQYSAESRNGKPYDFMGVIDAEFAKLNAIIERNEGFRDVVFNGECVVSDGEGGVLPRTTGNGIVQKFGKDTGSIIDAENIVAVLWDVLPLAAFNKGSWPVERRKRRQIIETALAELNKDYLHQCEEIVKDLDLSHTDKVAKLAALDHPKIRMVEYKEITSFAEAVAYNTQIQQAGGEGTIIKDDRGPWKSHTSPWQLKMKLKFEVDLRVVGFNPGKIDGKNAESLGSIAVESECGLVKFNIGSGFKENYCPKKDIGTKNEYPDNMVRDYIWNHQEEFLGKIVEGEANDITQDRNSDIITLYLCTFNFWRLDKNEADDLDRIRAMKEAAILSACGE